MPLTKPISPRYKAQPQAQGREDLATVQPGGERMDATSSNAQTTASVRS